MLNHNLILSESKNLAVLLRFLGEKAGEENKCLPLIICQNKVARKSDGNEVERFEMRKDKSD